MLAALVLATAALAASPAAAAQQDGVGVRFPDVSQVVADYPDDAERFIAFDILFNKLGEATRGTRTPGAYALSSAYLSARGEVQDKYDKQGRDSEVYKNFTNRSGRLFSDPTFKRSVYEKYGLTNLPAAGSGTSGGSDGGFVLFPELPGDRSDAEIKAAFLEAFPIWAATALGMIGLAWVLMRSAGVKTVRVPPPADSPFGLPQLPESLRTVSVAGRRYDVYSSSAQVIDRGPGGRTSGTDLVWVRTPDRHETSLTFSSGAFKPGPGHILSTIERPSPDGTGDVLVAYNHTTDQCEMFLGVHAVHATRILIPWLLVAVAGSIPGAFGLGLLFHRLGGLSGHPLWVSLLALWIMAGVTSAIIAAFVALRTKVKLEAARTRSFVDNYLPDYRRFFTDSTATLTRHFAQI
jgi:hypothetical protein